MAVLLPESQVRPGPAAVPGAEGIRRISFRSGSAGTLETLVPPDPVRVRTVLLGMGGMAARPGEAAPFPLGREVAFRGAGRTRAVERGQRMDLGTGAGEVRRGRLERGALLEVLGEFHGDVQVRLLGDGVLLGAGAGRARALEGGLGV